MAITLLQTRARSPLLVPLQPQYKAYPSDGPPLLPFLVQVSDCLPTLVPKLMDVAQDPKPAIKEMATLALRQCCSVISNPDVCPLIEEVIAANLDPSLCEACVDRLVATTYVAQVDQPTLSLIMPLLLRALRVRGSGATVRKASPHTHTPCVLSSACRSPLSLSLSPTCSHRRSSSSPQHSSFPTPLSPALALSLPPSPSCASVTASLAS